MTLTTILRKPQDRPDEFGRAIFMLSAFGDEIAADLEEQLTILARHNIRHLELRSAWSVNVANLDAAQVERVADVLRERNFKVSAIGSPIGKIKITDPVEPELARLERVISIAKQLGTAYIRVFSFFIPPDANPADYREEVLQRMAAFVKLAQHHDVVLLHENEKDIYGDTAERCLDILQTLNSPHLRLTFDPANFVQCGVKPFSEAYPLLSAYIAYVHIKDALFANGQVVVAGAGDGEVEQLLEILADRGYQGYLSFEPHLAASGTFSGFSGHQLFEQAVTALKTLLAKMENDNIYVN
jgi:3-dehydroshikimate dehydratase